MATTAEFWKEYIVTDFKDFLAEQLQNPEILAEYQALESEYNRMQAMYKLQAELERGYQIGQKEGWLSVDEVEKAILGASIQDPGN